MNLKERTGRRGNGQIQGLKFDAKLHVLGYGASRTSVFHFYTYVLCIISITHEDLKKIQCSLYCAETHSEHFAGISCPATEMEKGASSASAAGVNNFQLE